MTRLGTMVAAAARGYHARRAWRRAHHEADDLLTQLATNTAATPAERAAVLWIWADAERTMSEAAWMVSDTGAALDHNAAANLLGIVAMTEYALAYWPEAEPVTEAELHAHIFGRISVVADAAVTRLCTAHDLTERADAVHTLATDLALTAAPTAVDPLAAVAAAYRELAKRQRPTDHLN